jgi:hypothetical protein
MTHPRGQHLDDVFNFPANLDAMFTADVMSSRADRAIVRFCADLGACFSAVHPPMWCPISHGFGCRFPCRPYRWAARQCHRQFRWSISWPTCHLMPFAKVAGSGELSEDAAFWL